MVTKPEAKKTAASQLPEPPDATVGAQRAELTGDAIDVGGGTSADAHVVVAAAVQPGLEDQQAYAQAVEEIRQRRKAFGKSAQKLALAERRGYHRHWFNDTPGRVEEALSNGWAHVVGRDSKPVRRVVGTGRDNNALVAFAMELPTPIWEEDQAVLHKTAQDRLDDIKGAGAFRAQPGQAKPADAGKFYSASEEPLKVSQSVR